MSVDTASAEFFEAMYRSSPDPWAFASDAYETDRYDTILSALAPLRYRHAFEPGCSVGVLTQRLAGICDSMTASDFSPTAVEQARERCAHLAHVEIACAPLQDAPSFEAFDLVILSEIGYYFQAQAWAQLARHLVSSLRPGSTLLACHWLGSSADHRLSGDQVHEILSSLPLLRPVLSHRYAAFRLDKWIVP